MIVYNKDEIKSSKTGRFPTLGCMYGTIARDVRLHMERVGIYAAVFFAYLQSEHKDLVSEFEPEFVEHVQQLYILHDIGRVYVPVRFQNKAGGLTDEEFALIKKHTLYAEDALVSIYNNPFSNILMQRLENIALYHHERWNGTGYPYGLSGEAIPMEARICSLVDAFDGMTSWKPYRKSMGIEKVRSIVIEEAGKQFQPELAEAFAECITDMPDNLDESWENQKKDYFAQLN